MRSIRVSIVAAVMVVLSACGDDSAPQRPAGDAATADPVLALLGETTPCNEIREPAEAIGEMDFGVYPDQGLVMLSYSETVDGDYVNTSHLISYRDDPTCRRTPWIAALLDRVDR